MTARIAARRMVFSPVKLLKPVYRSPKETGREVRMATRAYLLVETAVGKTRDVANILRSLEYIESVDVVTGPYDIITVVSASDMTVVGDVVTDNIHTVDGVVRTVTCVAVGS